MGRHGGLRAAPAGRHAGQRRTSASRRLLAAALVVAAVAVIGWVAWLQFGPEVEAETQAAASTCTSRTPVSVTTTAAMEPTVTELAELATASCVTFTVVAAPASQTLQALGSGQGSPQLWIPDSNALADQVVEKSAGAVKALPAIATTPVLLAVPEGLEVPDSFTWGTRIVADTLRLPDPNSSTVGQIALTAGLAEIESLPEAQSRAALSKIGGMLSRIVPEGTLFATYAEGQDAATFPATEQQVAQAAVSGITVRAATATPQLEYPVVVLDPDAAPAAADLVATANSSAGGEVLRRNGFRTPTDSSPIAEGAPAQGDVGAELTQKQATAAARIEASITTPTRLLTVIDTSGSMAHAGIGGRSRVEVAAQAATGAIQLLADRNSVGLWTFSTAQQGTQDWTPVQPIARLDDDSHRAGLAYSLGALSSGLGGDTGLYDTLAASYAAVSRDYDPKAANLIAVFTDGVNDDSTGGLDLDQLTQRLSDIADPKRPITVLLIGMGGVDATALAPVAEAVPSGKAGGASVFTIAKPGDIGDVYTAVLLKRGPTG